MGLVGTLEDLSLGDLLQILGLARKSGLLMLQGAEGEGWILFRNGQVAGAAAKGGPPDLPTLLGGASEPPPEHLEAMRRDAAEQAVVRMLGWQAGEFRFDAGSLEGRVAATGLVLAQAIPSEYLALEGVRVQDETALWAASPEAGRILSGEEPAGEAAPAAPLPIPLVVIDPALGALEWLKQSLSESFALVHIFQRTELGVMRIRQYLARGERLAVLLARHARPDPVTGIRDSAELVARLHQQAPRMPIVLLVERDGASGRLSLRSPPPRGLAGVVARPSEDVLQSRRGREAVEASARALRDALREAVDEALRQ